VTALAAQLAAATFRGPTIDYHALAPEIILTATVVVLVLLDSIKLDRARALMPVIASFGLLGSLIPLLTLAHAGGERVLFGGSYVVGPMALMLKAMFIVSTYVVVLISINYVAEGDYWESEYYTLLVSSLLGMVVMCSSRDLIGIFVALELLSLPAYMLASWRKGDVRSNEAGLKYFLMGVFASAVLLYGMSLVYGLGGSTQLTEIGKVLRSAPTDGVPVITLALLFCVVGFAFKVSAVPFHVWAPDTYEGAPTPVTTFLAVASKAAGFVALINLVFFAFLPRTNIIQPLFFVLAVASMFVGNLAALRQTNVVRMLAYSGIAHAGFMLAPFVVAGESVRTTAEAMRAVVVYLVIYAAMNLGAFAVIIAIARKTRSAELDDLRGIVHTMPGMAWAMVLFLASLIGMPPLGGWFAKFAVFKVVVNAGTTLGWVTAICMAINTAIAAYYYLAVAKAMVLDDAPDGDTAPAPRTPPSLTAAVAITLVATLAFGVLPSLLTNVTDYGFALAR